MYFDLDVRWYAEILLGQIRILRTMCSIVSGENLLPCMKWQLRPMHLNVLDINWRLFHVQGTESSFLFQLYRRQKHLHIEQAVRSTITYRNVTQLLFAIVHAVSLVIVLT